MATNRYSIDLGNEIHKDLKIKSIEKGISMRKIVLEALELYLYGKTKGEGVEKEKHCNRSDCPVTVEHEHTQKLRRRTGA